MFIPPITDSSTINMNILNTYWIIRHGQSTANRDGIIVSSRKNGLKDQYGLTETGKIEAKEAGEQLKARIANNTDHLFFYTSPFSRAQQTAQIVLEEFKLPSSRLQIRDKLQERYFGDNLELTSHENYHLVWERDVNDLNFHNEFSIESIQDVSHRLQYFLKEMEKVHQGCDIVIVSHGDVISVASVLLKNANLHTFRNYGTKNCEICLFSP